MVEATETATAVDALKALMQLIEDGDLVRNISKDYDFPYFMHQGIRITKAIGMAKTVLEGDDHV